MRKFDEIKVVKFKEKIKGETVEYASKIKSAAYMPSITDFIFLPA